jgi:acyl carrier protein
VSTTELTARISDLIRETLMVEVPGPDVDLIDADSLALITLITEIEQDFQIQLPLDDFDVDSFRSAAQIAAYVAANRGQ